MSWRYLHVGLLILMFLCSGPFRALAADEAPAQSSQYATQSSALTAGDGGGSGLIDATDKAFAPASDFQLPAADASASGTLMQPIQIAAPPGRHGQQPALRLTYASEGPGDGQSGYGWTLGWVTLTRQGARAQVPPHTYTETIVSGNDPDDPNATSTTNSSAPHWATERYHLSAWGSGMELVFDSATEIFAPRYQNWWRVLPSAEDTFTQWTAQSPDGMTYLFTADVIAGKNIERNIQYIDEMRSPDGLTNMFFTYRAMKPHSVGALGDIAGIVPEEIQYSCPQRDDPTCYRVVFEYDPLPAPVLAVRHGTLIATTERLAHIIAQIPTGGIAVQYDFNYSIDPFNGRSLLTGVTRQDGAGASALPPTTFTYQEATPPTDDWTVSEAPSVLPPISYEGQIIDFSCPMLQPGAIALMEAGNDFPVCHWSPSINSDGNHATIHNMSYPLDQVYHYGPTILGPWDTGAFFTDLNDDGLPDLVRRFQGPGTTGGQPVPWVLNCLNQGNLGFACEPQEGNDFWWSKMSVYEVTNPLYAYASHAPARYRIKREQRTVVVADLEGDRRADVVESGEPLKKPSGLPSQIMPLWVVKNLDGKGSVYDPMQPLPANIFTAHARLFDVNGDGASDAVISNSPADMSSLQFDISSNEDSGEQFGNWIYDPLTEQYVGGSWKSPVYFYWRIAHEDGFVSTPLQYAYHDLQVQVVDLNGDGLLDLYSMPDVAGRNFNNFKEDGAIDLQPPISESAAVGQRGIFLNTGNGWADVTKQWTVDWSDNSVGSVVGVEGVQYPGFHVEDYPDWQFLDVNGDGLADLVESSFRNLCLGQVGGGWRCLAAGSYSRPSLGVDDSYVGKYMRLGDKTKKAESITDDTRQLIPPRYRFVDLDGDRFPDLLDNHGVINAYQQQITKLPGHAVLNPLTTLPNVLTTVTNPLGARTEIGYRTITQFGQPTGGPRTVVNHVSQWISPNEISGVTLYGYHEPAYVRPGPEACEPCQDYDPLRGPEFLGFRKVDRISVGFVAGSAPDLLSGGEQPHDLSAVALPGEVGRRRQTTHYGAGYAYAQTVIDSHTAISQDGGANWAPITTTTHTWHTPDTTQQTVSLSPPYLVIPASTTQTFHEGQEETITTLYAKYNAFGLPTLIETHGRAAYEDSVKTERFYTNLTEPRIVGLLSQETVTTHGQYRTMTTTHDNLGRVTQQQVVASNMPANYIKTDYTYDAFGNVLTATALGALPNDPARTTTYAYDTTYRQFVTSVTNPLQQVAKVTRYGIDTSEPLMHPAHFGRVARTFGLTLGTAPPTRSTNITYDNFGRLSTQVQMVVGDTTPVATTAVTYAPDPAQGTITTTTQLDQQGQRTVTDAFGRVIRTEQQGDNGWRVAEQRYGSFGHAWRQSAPHYTGATAQWTETDVDPLGRLVLVTTPTQVASYEYPTAFVTRVTDGKGFTQEVERDGQGRVVRSVVAGAETKVYFDNDPFSSIQIVDPGGFSTHLQRNGFGMVIKRIDPDRGTWQWTYDGDGNVETQVDGNGKSTRYRYDALGRSTQVDWGDDGSTEIRNYYDGQTPQSTVPVIRALGQLSATVDPSGQSLVTYHNRGLPLFITRQVDGVWHKMALTHDAQGRLTEYAHRQTNTVWPINLFRVQYGYTRDGLATVKAQLGNAAWQSMLTNLQYGEDGQIESQTLGNGLTETFGYAPEGRLLQSRVVQGAAGTPLLRFGYQYDPLDASLTGVTDLANSVYTQTFQYAPDKTLQSATSGLYPPATYTVLPDGRTSQNGFWAQEYGDAAHQRAVSKATNSATGAVRTYSYTSSGDVLLADDRLFTYNPAHQVIRMTSNQGTLDLMYDAKGAWVKQVVNRFAGKRPVGNSRPKSPPTERPLPNAGQSLPTNRAVGSTATVGNPPININPPTQGPDLPIKPPMPVVVASTTIVRPFDSVEIVTTTGKPAQRRYHVLVGGQRIATMVQGDAKGPRFYHTDHVGSRVLTTDKNGAPLGKRIGYTPYGSPVNADKQFQWTDWDDPGQLFTGIPLAQVTDLYLTTFRIYDPVIGRFLQPDPIAQAATSGIRQDPYLYAGANPAMFVDPLGLDYYPVPSIRTQQIALYQQLAAESYGGMDHSPVLTFAQPTHPAPQFLRTWDPGTYGGLYWAPGNSQLSSLVRYRGQIWITSETLSTMYHEWGHHLHISERTLDLAGNFLGSGEGKELIADLYRAQHDAYWAEGRRMGYAINRPVIDDLIRVCGAGAAAFSNCSTFTDILIFGETTFVQKSWKGQDGPGDWKPRDEISLQKNAIDQAESDAFSADIDKSAKSYVGWFDSLSPEQQSEQILREIEDF